jgi:RHO protein GDP dissociation inhibitor
VDKLEQMLGSYAPHKDGEPYTKNFDPEDSPSGMLARSGTYNVRSRVIDDDGEIYAGMLNITRMPFYSAYIGDHRLRMVFQACQGVVDLYPSASVDISVRVS